MYTFTQAIDPDLGAAVEVLHRVGQSVTIAATAQNVTIVSILSDMGRSGVTLGPFACIAHGVANILSFATS